MTGFLNMKLLSWIILHSVCGLIGHTALVYRPPAPGTVSP